LIARQNERTALQAGDVVGIEIDTSAAHFFDAQGRVAARSTASLY